jgi:hypothetical protein
MYYIKYLDMFRAILCSSSGGQNCIVTSSGIVTRPCSAPVGSGMQSALNRCPVRPLTECDIPDAVKYNFDLLRMSILLLD